MYKSILVPLDGSTFAEACLPLALALTRKTNASLHLISVVEPIPAFAYAEWEPAALDWSTQYLASVAAGRQHVPGFAEAIDYVSVQNAFLRSWKSERWEDVHNIAE